MFAGRMSRVILYAGKLHVDPIIKCRIFVLSCKMQAASEERRLYKMHKKSDTLVK